MLGKNYRQNTFWNIFLILFFYFFIFYFFQKIGFDISMQTVPWEDTFSLLSGKNKTIINWSSAEFAHGAVMVKELSKIIADNNFFFFFFFFSEKIRLGISCELSA